MNIPPITHNSESANMAFEGYLLFLPFAEGSKSEGLRPFLVNASDGAQMLYRAGDNPFENFFLRPFRGKYCRITGHMGEGAMLLVDSVKELKEPSMTSIEDENQAS
jgi:hypothetical protein